MPPGSTEGMNPEFARRLNALINASGGKLYIVSGYRSIEEQQRLYNEGLAKYGPEEVGKWVAPPGRSNHNHGIAADLGGDLAWAADNASRFGLYFPMSWEPWHIEMTDANVVIEHGDHPTGAFDPSLGWTEPDPRLVDPVANAMRNLQMAVMNPTSTSEMGALAAAAAASETGAAGGELSANAVQPTSGMGASTDKGHLESATETITPEGPR